jgi:hypothetical protein
VSKIPDPGSQIRIKEFKYFQTKKLFLSFQKYDPGCSSRIRILIFYPSRIPDPGAKMAPDPGSGSRNNGGNTCYGMCSVVFRGPKTGILNKSYGMCSIACRGPRRSSSYIRTSRSALRRYQVPQSWCMPHRTPARHVMTYEETAVWQLL